MFCYVTFYVQLLHWVKPRKLMYIDPPINDWCFIIRAVIVVFKFLFEKIKCLGLQSLFFVAKFYLPHTVFLTVSFCHYDSWNFDEWLVFCYKNEI